VVKALLFDKALIISKKLLFPLVSQSVKFWDVELGADQKCFFNYLILNKNKQIKPPFLALRMPILIPK